MSNIKRFLNRETLLLLLVHIFWADGTIIIGSYLVFSVLMFYSGLDAIHPLLMNLISLLFPVLILLKFTGLPITYSFLNKLSKSEMILGFIENLKNNKKFQKNALIISLIPTLVLYISMLSYNIMIQREHAFRDCTLIALFMAIFINIFGSYLALFAGWKIKKNVVNRKKPQI